MQHRDNTRPKGGLRSTFLRHVRRQQAGNGDNQSGVARDQSLVPQTPSSSVFGPGSQNNIGGGEFNNHQGDQTYVAVHIHKSGVVNTSVDEFQGTSEGIDQTNLEDKTYRPSGNKPVFRTDPMPPDKEPTPHNTVSTQKSQRSNQLYELYLMRKGRGYPLWIPQANMRLPKPYRATGVSIGDVGFITPSGGFDFLFNICLPCDNPINPNQLPMNFTPIHPPLHPSEIREFPEFSSGSYLASSSITMSQTESQTLEMVFESSASEGAILTMPHGAYQEELRNIARFRDYITTHAEDWYRHVNLTHGCENGDLHLVVGSDKSTSWGMATFKNASRWEKFHLKFQPLGTDNWLSSQTTCIWRHSGMADVRSGPDVREINELGATPDNLPRNQCLFLRTLSISLSSTAWEKATQKVKVAGNGLGKYNVNGSDATSPPNMDQQGESSSASINRYPINNAHDGQSRGCNVLLVDPFPSPPNPHPSKVINDFLLKQQPTAVVAVTHDRDWQYIKAWEMDSPSTSDFLDRISSLNDACLSNGAAYLQLKSPGILDERNEKEELLYLKQGFKSNQDKMTLNRYLFGDSEIYRQNLLVFCGTLKSTFRPYKDHLEEISQQIPSSLIDCHYRMLPLDELLSLLRDSDYPDGDTSRENAISSHHCLFITNHPTDDHIMPIQNTRMKAAYGFSRRYYRLNQEDDLEEAIALLQDVLVDAPTEHYLYLDALLALAPLLHKRYLIKGVPQDLSSLVENLEIQVKLDFKALLHPFEQKLANSIPPDSSDISEAASQSISKEFVSRIIHVSKKAGVPIPGSMADPSDIIETCLNTTPIPGLHSVFVVLKLIWKTMQDLQSLKEQLRVLAGIIAQLLQTLDQELRTGRLVEANTTRELKNLHSLLVDISVFVQSQASYGILKIIYKQAESIQAIEQFYRRISTTVQAFNITALLDLQELQDKNALARIQDQDSLNNRLASLESNQTQLAEQLGKQHSSVMAMMISLQKTLDKHANASINARERQFLSHSLDYLASSSGQRAAIRVDNWSITSFEVEFGTEIGSGGFGQVYKGVWNKTPVALKVLRAEEGGVPSSAFIRREIEAWSNLRHPHVLQFLGANIFDDRPFIVMPYLKNGNAREFIQSNPSCDRLRILHHAALGLMHLHSQNVIHGDLKALNILIDDAWNAVLCDFGLSRVKADASSRSVKPGAATSATSVAGSRNWMSPERILGGALRKPVDIYAFGMTIYEIFTGDIPLGHLGDMEFIDLVVQRDVRPEQPDEGEAPDLSDELWALAERCWQKTAKYRPDAAILCDELEQLASLPRNMALISLDSGEDLPDSSSHGPGPRDTDNYLSSLPPPPVPKEEQKSSSSAISVDKPSLEHALPAAPPIIDVSNKAGVPTPGFSSRVSLAPTSESRSNIWSGSTAVNSSGEFPSDNGKYTSRAKALFDFRGDPSEPNEMSLTKGEVIHVLDNTEKWWVAKRADGQQGIVPSNYVQIVPKETKGGTNKAKWEWDSVKIWGRSKDAKPSLSPQPHSASQPPLQPDISFAHHSNPTSAGNSELNISAKPLPSMSSSVFKARARYSYRPPPEEIDRLPFSEGDLLDILDKKENWWIARRADGKEGIVPSNYMQAA